MVFSWITIRLQLENPLQRNFEDVRSNEESLETLVEDSYNLQKADHPGVSFDAVDEGGTLNPSPLNSSLNVGWKKADCIVLTWLMNSCKEIAE